MSTLGRRVLLWMIPLNVTLIAWVWFGRVSFGVFGWMVLILAVRVVPFLILGLLLTTVLALTQPGRPRSLTRPQAWAQVTTWVALFLAGTFVPDVTDEETDSASVLTRIFGPSDALFQLSWNLMVAFGVLAALAWLVLLVTLTHGRRRVPDAPHTPEVPAASGQ